MITFDDAVTALNLPAQTHGVYYVDGLYANGTAVRDRLGPKATLLGITVRGATGRYVQICDCENGDLTPAQAVAWVEKQLALGVYRPCVYASESTWKSGLEAQLAKYGSKIRRWMAWYGTAAVVPVGFDAIQYASNTKVDLDVALDTFFATSAPAPPPVVKKPAVKPKPKPAPKPAPAPKPSPSVIAHEHMDPVPRPVNKYLAWLKQHLHRLPY